MQTFFHVHAENLCQPTALGFLNGYLCNTNVFKLCLNTVSYSLDRR